VAEVEEKYDLKGIEGFVKKAVKVKILLPKKQKKLKERQRNRVRRVMNKEIKKQGTRHKVQEEAL